jgi:hypothetical protein
MRPDPYAYSQSRARIEAKVDQNVHRGIEHVLSLKQIGIFNTSSIVTPKTISQRVPSASPLGSQSGGYLKVGHNSIIIIIILSSKQQDRPKSKEREERTSLLGKGEQRTQSSVCRPIKAQLAPPHYCALLFFPSPCRP